MDSVAIHHDWVNRAPKAGHQTSRTLVSPRMSSPATRRLFSQKRNELLLSQKRGAQKKKIARHKINANKFLKIFLLSVWGYTVRSGISRSRRISRFYCEVFEEPPYCLLTQLYCSPHASNAQGPRPSTSSPSSVIFWNFIIAVVAPMGVKYVIVVLIDICYIISGVS